MPRDGSGNYARAVDPYVGGEIAEADGADGVNTEMDDIADALSDSLARNGEAPFTGDQDAAGFTVGGLRASTANGEAVRHEQLSAYMLTDVLVTAIAGLTVAAGDVIYATGVDLVSTAPSTSFGRSIWNAADAAALRTLAALGTAAVATIGTSGDAVGKLNTNKTDSGNNTHTGSNLFSGADANVITFYRSGAAAKSRWIESTNNNAWGARNDANTLKFDYNGTDRVEIDASGNAVFDGALTAGGSVVLTTATGAQLGAANFFTAQQTVQSTTFASFQLYSTGAGTNEKYQRWWNNGGTLGFDFVNDAYSSATSWLTVTRSGQSPVVAEFDVCDLRIEPTPTGQASNSAGFRGLGAANTRNSAYSIALSDNGRSVKAASGTPTYTLEPQSTTDVPEGFAVYLIAESQITLSRGSGVALYNYKASGAPANANVTIPQGGCGLLWNPVGDNNWHYKGDWV
ncbi:hypothetical protein [Vitreimonas flagellata]|uniref:hypothetical protein n=1 Tax=Vitreimonas flagellata TaxID=2560861 RepID=UPI00107512D1|nr:hypothetical protein [Vitreimonas flagellata]